MTHQEALTKARTITAGSNCFFHQRGDRYQVFRRVDNRVIPLGSRSTPESLCAYLRKLVTAH